MAKNTEISLRNKVIYSVYVRNHTNDGTFNASSVATKHYVLILTYKEKKHKKMFKIRKYVLTQTEEESIIKP